MGSITDWDAQVVIGSKARSSARVASEQDVSSARRAGGVVDTDKKAGTGNKAHADPDHQVGFLTHTQMQVCFLRSNIISSENSCPG